jgi:hypothetical protein
MGRGMVKPIIFLATEPVVQVFALYMAVLYGVLYLSLTSEPCSTPLNPYPDSSALSLRESIHAPVRRGPRDSRYSLFRNCFRLHW